METPRSLEQRFWQYTDRRGREAPGTPLNNHRFDALGLKANSALAKARGEA